MSFCRQDVDVSTGSLEAIAPVSWILLCDPVKANAPFLEPFFTQPQQ